MTNKEAKEMLFDMLSDSILIEPTKQNKAIIMAIKALEQEPCEDAISRQAALDTFGLSEKSRKYGGDHSGYDTILLYEVQDALEALPPVTPQPKVGRWVKTPKAVMGEGYMWYCDKCEYKVYQDSSRDYPSEKYCPNCGQPKM